MSYKLMVFRSSVKLLCCHKHHLFHEEEFLIMKLMLIKCDIFLYNLIWMPTWDFE